MGRKAFTGKIVNAIIEPDLSNDLSQDDLPRDSDFCLAEEAQPVAARRSSHFVRLAQLRKLRECEQVAAVCYRVRNGEIEFLLVRTGGGRWTFPKGSAEAGLTHAQAAALEAFEEAGVHGRMQESSFTRYVYRKRTRNTTAEFAVSAHLCEVLRLEAPEESDRNPTWFSAAKAKKTFREDHASDSGVELARVVDRAVRRIRRLHEAPRAKFVPALKAKIIEINTLRKPRV
jgi:8-oxo-dGTP pyrophosphatase MutT (NUDIX family)